MMQRLAPCFVLMSRQGFEPCVLDFGVVLPPAVLDEELCVLSAKQLGWHTENTCAHALTIGVLCDAKTNPDEADDHPVLLVTMPWSATSRVVTRGTQWASIPRLTRTGAQKYKVVAPYSRRVVTIESACGPQIW